MRAEVLSSSLPASLHLFSPTLSHSLFSGLEVIYLLFLKGGPHASQAKSRYERGVLEALAIR